MKHKLTLVNIIGIIVCTSIAYTLQKSILMLPTLFFSISQTYIICNWIDRKEDEVEEQKGKIKNENKN